jgi:Tol biopolymer transport system component
MITLTMNRFDSCRSRPACRAFLLRLAPAILLLTVLLTLATSAGAADLVNRKLSGTLPPDGRVLNFEISPDGAWVVFTAYQDAALTEALFATPADGSLPPQQINAPLPSGEYFEYVAISPDSSRVVYLTSRNYTATQLYSVPIDGSGSPVPLTPPMESWETIQDFLISPDSSRLVYRGDLDSDTVDDLYSVPVDGSGASVKLKDPLVIGGDTAYDYEISPDSSRVVYRADHDTTGVVELYAVPLDGSSLPVKLNGPLVSGGNVVSFAISPDNSRVVYRADQQIDEVFELGSVPLDGSSPPIRLNGPLVPGGDVNFSYAISPDSSRVVYRADQQTDEVLELYSVRLTGGGHAKLNGPLVTGGYISSDFQFSPDGGRVVYLADQDTDEVYELYSVRVDGTDRVTLNKPLVDGDVVSYAISPDGNQVAFTADQDTDDVFELYSVPLDGSSLPLKLNSPLAPGSDILFYFRFSPDSRRIVYWADQDTDDVRELYSVALQDGATSVKLNGTLAAGGRVGNFLIGPNSNHVVYEAEQETAGVTELFVTFEEPPQVSFMAGSAAVQEDAGNATIIVQLSESFDTAAVTVDYAVTGGTASNGVDFDLPAATLLFAPGVITQTVTITLIDDLLAEPDETVVISLTNPDNGVLASPDSFTLTIVDDDSGFLPAAYTLYLPVASKD